MTRHVTVIAPYPPLLFACVPIAPYTYTSLFPLLKLQLHVYQVASPAVSVREKTRLRVSNGILLTGYRKKKKKKKKLSNWIRGVCEMFD